MNYYIVDAICTECGYDESFTSSTEYEVGAIISLYSCGEQSSKSDCESDTFRVTHVTPEKSFFLHYNADIIVSYTDPMRRPTTALLQLQ